MVALVPLESAPLIRRVGAVPAELERRLMVDARELACTSSGAFPHHGDAAVREVLHRLEDVPETGLARRVRREVESVEDEFGVVVRVDLPADDTLIEVPRSIADAVVKIVREATVNAAKHAGPCRTGVGVSVDAGALRVSVVDDGFDSRTRPTTTGGRGLASLRRVADEAGGTIVVTTPPAGFGTQVVATFPSDRLSP